MTVANTLCPSLRGLSVLVSITLLSACHPGSSTAAQQGPENEQLPGGITPADIANIKQMVSAGLGKLLFRPSYDGVKYPCTMVFDLAEPAVIDLSVTDDTGKAMVTIPITAARPFDRGVEPSRFIIPNDCYGAPPSGWAKGQLLIARYQVNIEKWQSGWKIAEQQTWEPV